MSNTDCSRNKKTKNWSNYYSFSKEKILTKGFFYLKNCSIQMIHHIIVNTTIIIPKKVLIPKAHHSSFDSLFSIIVTLQYNSLIFISWDINFASNQSMREFEWSIFWAIASNLASNHGFHIESKNCTNSWKSVFCILSFLIIKIFFLFFLESSPSEKS